MPNSPKHTNLGRDGPPRLILAQYAIDSPVAQAIPLMGTEASPK
jgi:hypothetical protein